MTDDVQRNELLALKQVRAAHADELDGEIRRLYKGGGGGNSSSTNSQSRIRQLINPSLSSPPNVFTTINLMANSYKMVTGREDAFTAIAPSSCKLSMREWYHSIF